MYKRQGLALAWALAARAWQITPDDALAAWLWGWLENQLAVLMKVLPLGQHCLLYTSRCSGAQPSGRESG